MAAETDRSQEVLSEFQIGSLLVPIAMKIVLMDEVNTLRTWGDHRAWVSFVMSRLGRTDPLEIDTVMEIIRAGKKRVWGEGTDNLKQVVDEMLKRWQNKDTTVLDWWRSHLLSSAVRATVMAMSFREELAENMEMMEIVGSDPGMLREVLSQLGLEIEKGEAERLTKVFTTIDWGVL